MQKQACSVGDGLSRAMARADELRATSPRRVGVKIVTRHADLDPGVIIVASIPAKTNPELEVQLGKGVRYVSLAELDARAHELVDLVDEAAAEIEAAVAAAPKPPERPSRGEADFDGEAYSELVENSLAAMLSVSRDLVVQSWSSLSRGGAAEAVAVAALRVAALAAQGARIELSDLADMLGFEFREARQLASDFHPTNAKVH